MDISPSDDVMTMPAAGAADEVPPPLPQLPEPIVKYASWGSRVGAFVVDGFIEGIAQLFFGLIFGAIAAGFLTATGAATDFSGMSLFSTAVANAFSVLWVATSVLNRVILQWYYGGTLAKLLFGISVMEVKAEGTHTEVRFWTLVKRYLVFWISVVPFLLGLLAPLWTRRKQTFHDLLCDTVVVENR